MFYEAKPEWCSSRPRYVTSQGQQRPKSAFSTERTLSPMERKVLTIVRNNMTPHGYYPYSYDLMAKEIGCTELTVMRSIRQLNFLGYVDVVYQEEDESGGVLRVL